jgi:hypothetical protein
MPNTILTPTQITRKALMVLHQKSNFIGRINRQYDDRFAQDGAKIGTGLLIRLPNEYSTGTGATVSSFQDTIENSTTLTVATQRWSAMNFLSSELTLSLDDFADRVIEPAVSKLGDVTEADAFTMTRDVFQQVGTPGTPAATALVYLQAMAAVSNALAPKSKRCNHIPPADMAAIVDALKGLFQDSGQIAEQYRDGIMGRGMGADWYENTLTDRITNGNKVAAVTVSGASQVGSSITLGGLAGSDTFKKGQILTFAGCNRVHPTTKADTGILQQFVVTADATSAGATLAVSISPAIVVTGATQNVSASPTNGGAVTVAGTASLVYGANLHFYKDAFAIAFADLVMPKGTDMASRQVMDGISLRLVRDFDTTNDKFLTRLDVLYGYKAIRPVFACRVASS